MNTEEMIRGLARESPRVKRPARPLIMFLTWSAIGGFYLAAGILLIGTRGDLAQVWRQSEFLIHTLMVLGVTVLAAAAAFVMSIPNRQSPWTMWIPAIALAAWLICLASALAASGDPHAGDGLKCVKNIVVLGVPIGALMYRMMGTAAPLRTSAAGWLASLSAFAAGDLATRFICRHDQALHALVWHFVPVLVMGGTGVVLGRVLLCRQGAYFRRPEIIDAP
jgi:hypothetical protein